MSVRNGFLIAAVVGALSVGCASQPRPDSEITRARTLIEQAEQAGAQRYAAVELDQARNKLRLADAAAQDGKQVEAKARANEAAADAQLAIARAHSGEAAKNAEEVRNSTDTLRSETERSRIVPRAPDTVPAPVTPPASSTAPEAPLPPPQSPNSL